MWSDEDHTKVVLNARDTLLLSTTRSGKGVQNLSRYAPVIKLDRYASCLRRDSAWYWGCKCPHHSDTGHEQEACCVT